MDSIMPIGQKNTLAEYMILSGAENRPPILDKDLYDSWKSIMELYMQNKENKRMRLESVEHGLLIWPTIEENGVTGTKKYVELSATEKIQANYDLKEINIIFQGLPSDIFSLVNHHRVAKDLCEKNSTSNTRFTQLINDMNIYKMKMEQFQVNTKFLNSLPPEWSKFVTDVKLVKDLHTTNFDQLHAYLEQHELHANKVCLMHERSQDPLALVANHQMTPSHFNTYQSSYNNPQFQQQQQFSPSQSPQYGSTHPTQHYSTTYPSTPLAITYPLAPYPNAYSSTIHQEACPQPYFGLAVPVFKQGDDPNDAINKMMSFLSTIVTSCFPCTNNQLRNSSNPRQQATVHDGRCPKPKRKRDATWFRDKVLLVEAQGNGKVLNEKIFRILEDPVLQKVQLHNLVITHNAAYQAYDLDAYDSDCDEISTAKAVLMANFSSYGSDVLNQSFQEMLYFEPSHFVEHPENEIHSDSNIILQNVDLSTREKLIIDDIIREKNAQFADFKKEINNLKQTLSEQSKEKELLTKTFNVSKNKSKEKEAKNIDIEIALEKKVKELDNIVSLGFQNPFYLKKAQQIRPMLYDGNVIAKETNVISIADSEETLMLEEESRSKMLLKQKLSDEQALHPITDQSASSPVKIEAPRELPKVSLVNTSLKKLKYHLGQFDNVVKKRITPNALTEGEWGFEHTKAVFQKEIIPFLKTLKDIFNVFDKDLLNEVTEVQTVFNQMEAVVQQYHVDKQCFEIQKKQFLIENDRLLDQIISQDIVNIVVNSSVDVNTSVKVNSSVVMNDSVNYVEMCNKCLELEAELIKQHNMVEKDEYNRLSKRFSELEQHCISLEIAMQLNKEIFQKNNTSVNQTEPSFNQLFELNNLKAELQAKDTTIEKLKAIIKRLNKTSTSNSVKKDIDEIETINIELEHRVTKLIAKNEHLKQTYKQFYDSIKPSRAQAKEHVESLVNQLTQKSVEITNLNAPLQEKVFVITALKNDLRKLKGKDIVDNAAQVEAHIYYLKHTMEQAAILREIVKQAKSLNPLDSASYSACIENFGKLQAKADICIFIGYAPKKKAYRIYNRRTRKIIETIHVDFDELTAMASKQSSLEPALLEMTPATPSSGLVPNPPPPAPFVPPLSNEWDLVFQPVFDEFFSPLASVTSPVLVVEAPQSVSQSAEEESHDLEFAHMSNDPYFGIPIPETVSEESSSSGVIPTTVHLDAPISETPSVNGRDVEKLEDVLFKLESSHDVLACSFDAAAKKGRNKRPELLGYVRDTCPDIHKPSKKLVVVTPINKKKIVSSMFDARHELCFLEFVSDMNGNSKSKPVKKAKKNEEWKPTGKVVQIVLWYLDFGCSKHMTRDRSQLTNFDHKFLDTVKFGNDYIAKIMGYGDYHIGNITISRVYYVEVLGHNLFSVGQFCDSDLEVAFRKCTCFICNIEGVDLLSRSQETNLYTLLFGDMIPSSPICLLSKASKTKLSLWHRRLSHLNFDAINHLARHGLVEVFPN
ncbi:retrovirus-related pol polyprotein from transposon TNT 1-94 [Tanacetum coccineum]